MTIKHETEGRCSCRVMNLCIVGIFLWLNKLFLIGLMLGHVMAERGDNHLAKLFHVTIGLGMIGGRHQMSE